MGIKFPWSSRVTALMSIFCLEADRQEVLYGPFQTCIAVLAHNHPSGVALPSSEDVQTTRRVAAALAAVEVHLADHMVVADGDYVSLVQSGYRFDEYLLP